MCPSIKSNHFVVHRTLLPSRLFCVLCVVGVCIVSPSVAHQLNNSTPTGHDQIGHNTHHHHHNHHHHDHLSANLTHHDQHHQDHNHSDDELLDQTPEKQHNLLNLSIANAKGAAAALVGGNISQINDGKPNVNQNEHYQSEEERLHRFNNRFESMRRCQLPDSSCECLWNVQHLYGLIGQWENDSVTRDNSSNNGSKSFAGTNNNDDHDHSDPQRRQLSALMLANVLRLGSIAASNENQQQTNKWFKCVPTESICQFDWLHSTANSDRRTMSMQQQQRSYSKQRRQLLSALMPNMARQDGDGHTDHHHHHRHDNQSTELIDLLNSIELLTDIEELLRKISRQLDNTAKSNASPQQSNQDQQQTTKKCFDREDLLDDLRQQQQQPMTESSLSESESHSNESKESAIKLIYIEHLASFIVDRLASGECIELFESKFLRDIIHRYANKAEEKAQPQQQQSPSSSKSSATAALESANQSATLHINQDGFVKLLNDLHIGGLIENSSNEVPVDRPVDHDHHDQAHEHSDDDGSDHKLTTSRGHRSVSDNSDNHIDHSHNHHHHHQHSDHHHQHLPHPQPKSSSACLDYRYYLNRQGANGNNNNNKVLTENDLRELSPIFIQQILSGACEQLEPRDSFIPLSTLPTKRMSSKVNLTSPNSSSVSSQQLTNLLASDNMVWQVYLYSSIAVLIISVSSIAGVLLIPFLKNQYYSHLINLLIGLAFGSMAGDALFHLLPTVLGIHSHGEDEHDHDHDHDHRHEETETAHDHGSYMWLMVAVLMTIYALFLFEVFSNFIASKRSKGKHGHSHGHSHSHQQPLAQLNHQHSHNEDEGFKSVSSVPTLTKISSTNHRDHSTYSSSLTIDSTLTNQSNENDQQQQALQMYKNGSQVHASMDSMAVPEPERLPAKDNIPVLLGMTSLALIITIGDSIHNLLDGVAIGIAFSNSIASGISTSIAVFCHELPHEFGDFAVLLSTGLSVRRAAVINFISACTAFIGLYIGILLGNNDTANRWALAICAGLFLYVALVDMLPELKEMPSTEKGNREWYISLTVKNVGILFGIAFMIVLAQYEDLLNFA